MTKHPYHKWIHHLAVASLFVAVLLTIGLGGAVTSAEVGMAYPTWPDINGWSLFNFLYGEIASEFGAGASIEHTHRQAGTLIGLLAILLMVVCLRSKQVPPRWKKLSVVIFLLVLVQGLLGAVRVLGNDQAMAIAHAVGAQLCVVALMAMVKHSSRAWAEDQSAPTIAGAGRLQLWARVGVVVMFINLIAAASLRHKAGAFSGHLAMALLASGVILWVIRLCLTTMREHPRLRRGAKRLATLLGIQLGLGLGTWACLFGPLLDYFSAEQTRFLAQTGFATAHLVVGVAVLAQLTAIDMEARHRLIPVEPPAGLNR